MIDEFEPIDWGIVAGAAAMAVGAFCPIVSVPIIGSLNYVMGGRGDGIFVVGGSMVIILLVLFGYRRATAVIAGGLLVMMATTVVKFAAGMNSMQADAVRSAKSNPIGAGITQVLSQSVSLGWGWILLVGGAFTVIVCALLLGNSPHPKSSAPPTNGAVDLSSADQLIAEYLEKAKQPPRSHRSPSGGFGKRGVV